MFEKLFRAKPAPAVPNKSAGPRHSHQAEAHLHAARSRVTAADSRPPQQGGTSRPLPAMLPTDSVPPVRPSHSHSQIDEQGLDSTTDPIEPGPKLIHTDMGQIPAGSALLTMGGKQLMSLPESLRNRLTAIELGPGRGVILYDPSLISNPKGAQVIAELRSRMRGAGISPPRTGDMACSRELIERVVSDFASRLGGGSAAAGRSSTSNAGNLYLNWVRIAVREKATDIHARVTAPGRGEVQIRVDGELEMLPDEKAGGVYTESELVAAMSFAFNSTAQAGSNSEGAWQPKANLYCMTEPMDVDGHRVALRYQSVVGHSGPKMVARVLNVGADQPTLSYEQLGYETTHREIWMEVAKMSSGMAVLAGVTGSGKTTSLKTFVETHPSNGHGAFFSLEDPVEYLMKGVHQIPLQRSLGDKQASLRSFMQVVEALMRMDPDMVIVGEIRDAASAAAAQAISNTGHMALGTVHAHLISGIIPRMTDEEVGMKRNVLTNPNILSLLAYQALVPKLCPKCALDHKNASDMALSRDRGGLSPNGMEAAELSSSLRSLRERFRVDLGQLRFRNFEGCAHCNGRGTKGLTVVAEMLIPDRRWLELTREGRDYEAMRYWREGQSDRNFMSDNMNGKTVFEHCLYKALLGNVDPRQCERFDTFARFEILPPSTRVEG